MDLPQAYKPFLSKAELTQVAIGSPQQLCEQTNQSSLEEAFITLIGTDEGIAA